MADLGEDRSHGRVTDLTPALRRHWRQFLVEGIILVLLGVAAIVVPSIASLAVAIFLGWLFLVGGVVGLVTTIVGRDAPGFWWSLTSAIVAIIAGCLLIGWPVRGIVSLTLVLIAFLIADGFLTILFSLEHRRSLSRRWGWLFANGILDLLLAALIIWALPGSAVWVLGLIVGIDLVFGGYSLVVMAIAARTSAPA
jgi:uncharacterized membrane protein HdeD (DUF308 family)